MHPRCDPHVGQMLGRRCEADAWPRRQAKQAGRMRDRETTEHDMAASVVSADD